MRNGFYFFMLCLLAIFSEIESVPPGECARRVAVVATRGSHHRIVYLTYEEHLDEAEYLLDPVLVLFALRHTFHPNTTAHPRSTPGSRAQATGRGQSSSELVVAVHVRISHLTITTMRSVERCRAAPCVGIAGGRLSYEGPSFGFSPGVFV